MLNPGHWNPDRCRGSGECAIQCNEQLDRAARRDRQMQGITGAKSKRDLAQHYFRNMEVGDGYSHEHYVGEYRLFEQRQRRLAFTPRQTTVSYLRADRAREFRTSPCTDCKPLQLSCIETVAPNPRSRRCRFVHYDSCANESERDSRSVRRPRQRKSAP